MVTGRLENLIEKIDVDTFIGRCREILRESKRDQTSLVESQKEARILLRQFEEYLNSKGLECS
jgi:hypothetical protein